MKKEKGNPYLYWREVFESSDKRLDDAQKIDVVKAMLVNYCELNTGELNIFLDPNLTPSSSNTGLAMRYAGAEKKVTDYFNSSWPFPGTSEYEKRLKQHDSFVKDIKSTLLSSGRYTSGEIDEMLYDSGDDINGDALFVSMIVGTDFWVFRRIRNAYLPGITTLITGNINKNGQLTNVQDSTHALFDGPVDAVYQIEEILGIKPTDQK